MDELTEKQVEAIRILEAIGRTKIIEERETMKAEQIKTIQDLDNYIEGVINDYRDGAADYSETKKAILDCIQVVVAAEKKTDVITWVAFDFDKYETRPPKSGKYLITRKDGKIHWETWNGSGWAYNHNEIRYWAKIKAPNKV